MQTINQYQKAELVLNSWAEHYDYIYNQTYGEVLETLTKETVSEISFLLEEGSSIIDYGCATGRLAIPLAKEGYKIYAVDSCHQLLDILDKKCEKIEIKNIKTYSEKISDYKGPSADMALAVFYVFNYISTIDEMYRSLENIADHLNPNGHLLFDLPLDTFFQTPEVPVKNTLEGFYRQVELSPYSDGKEDSCYLYHDTCKGIDEQGIFGFEDKFIIRNWKINEIKKMLSDLNFERVQYNNGRLNRFGTDYYLFKLV